MLWTDIETERERERDTGKKPPDTLHYVLQKLFYSVRVLVIVEQKETFTPARVEK